MFKTTTTIHAISRDDKSVAKLTLQLQFILGHTLNGDIEDRRFHSVMNSNKKQINGKIRNVVWVNTLFLWLWPKVIIHVGMYVCSL